MLRGWLGLQEMLKASRKLQNCGKNKILREQSQNALAEGTAPIKASFNRTTPCCRQFPGPKG